MALAAGINDDVFIDDEDLDGLDTDDVRNGGNDNGGSRGGAADDNEEHGDAIDIVLRRNGIDDRDSIKFEGDDGEIKEFKWDDLSESEKANVLASSGGDDYTDSERQLIGVMRSAGLTPRDYLNAIQKQAVDNYVRNQQQSERRYKIDDYSDDELFVNDLLTRINAGGKKNITYDDAVRQMELAKEDPDVYKKHTAALRDQYRRYEAEQEEQERLDQEMEQQAQLQQLKNSVVEQLNDFSDFCGYELNLSNDDKQAVYDFITGTNAAGDSYLMKALQNPRTLTRMAWLALYGEQMVQGIEAYYKNQITEVRKNSYKKGRDEALGKDSRGRVAYKPSRRNVREDDDLIDDLD